MLMANAMWMRLQVFGHDGVAWTECYAWEIICIAVDGDVG